MGIETTDDNEFMDIDPELERIWREEDEPSFTEIRASMTTTEQPESNLADEDSVTVNTDNVDQAELTNQTEVINQVPEKQDNLENDAELDDEDAAEMSTFKIKANGVEYDLSLEELQLLAPKAMDYTKKMQEIAPWRRSISALKEQGLTESDVNLMIDVLKGDKQAIEEVLRRNKVDPLEIDTDSKTEYTPKQYGKDERASEIEDIVATISKDTEYVMTERIVDSEWDSRSRQAMIENPSYIMGLHNDIKNGTFAKVAPIMEKLRALDGGRMSDIEYYMEAGQRYFDSLEKGNTTTPQPVTQQVQGKTTAAQSSARKAASITKRTAGNGDIINYLDDNDDAFDEWYKKLQASQ